jgi:acyl carrier protein
MREERTMSFRVARSTDEEQLAGWLVKVLAATLQEEPTSVRMDVPLWEYGVDSLVVATLLAEIDDQLGVWVDPADVPSGITLEELASIVMASGEVEEGSDVA